jgi:hypothetical protein
MKKQEKKIFAKHLKVGDTLLYAKDGSRFGLQSTIQEVTHDGLMVKVKIIDGWLEFGCNDQVVLQMAESHFDNYTLQNRSSARQTVRVGNFNIGIE